MYDVLKVIGNVYYVIFKRLFVKHQKEFSPIFDMLECLINDFLEDFLRYLILLFQTKTTKNPSKAISISRKILPRIHIKAIKKMFINNFN